MWGWIGRLGGIEVMYLPAVRDDQAAVASATATSGGLDRVASVNHEDFIFGSILPFSLHHSPARKENRIHH